MSYAIWRDVERPGYFGRRRDTAYAALDEAYGKDHWRLVWKIPHHMLEFESACKQWYEESYYQWLLQCPGDVDFACSFGECMDNSITNIESGLDYTKQEAFSTHIQDIALRNVLKRLRRTFRGPSDKILVIRGAGSIGARFGPDVVPFFMNDVIESPSLRPKWATSGGSVEDFWQSNKWIQRLDYCEDLGESE